MKMTTTTRGVVLYYRSYYRLQRTRGAGVEKKSRKHTTTAILISLVMFQFWYCCDGNDDDDDNTKRLPGGVQCLAELVLRFYNIRIRQCRHSGMPELKPSTSFWWCFLRLRCSSYFPSFFILILLLTLLLQCQWETRCNWSNTSKASTRGATPY